MTAPAVPIYEIEQGIAILETVRLAVNVGGDGGEILDHDWEIMEFLTRATSSGSPGGLKTFATFVDIAREVASQLLVKVLERVLDRQGHAAAKCAE